MYGSYKIFRSRILCDSTYNYIIPSPLSAERDNSRCSLLEGTRGHETAKVLYNIIIHSGSDWKGCNVIRAHDTI